MYEGDHEAMTAFFDPLVAWAKAEGGTISGTSIGGVSWRATDTPLRLPWIEKHPDREISTALLASMSKLFPAHYMATDKGATALAEALVDMSGMYGNCDIISIHCSRASQRCATPMRRVTCSTWMLIGGCDPMSGAIRCHTYLIHVFQARRDPHQADRLYDGGQGTGRPQRRADRRVPHHQPQPGAARRHRHVAHHVQHPITPAAPAVQPVAQDAVAPSGVLRHH